MPPPKPAPAPRKRATKAETTRRVNEVYKLLASAARVEDIVAFAEKKAWGVNKRQLETYMKRAREQMAKDGEADRKEQIDIADAQLAAIQAKATSIGDHNNAIKARMARNKLRGLDAPTKLESLDLTPRAWELLAKIEALATRHKTTVEAILAHVEESLEGSERP
jgi:hypothetical protein